MHNLVSGQALVCTRTPYLPHRRTASVELASIAEGAATTKPEARLGMGAVSHGTARLSASAHGLEWLSREGLERKVRKSMGTKRRSRAQARSQGAIAR